MSMSTLTTEALWRKSGRFESVRSEVRQALTNSWIEAYPPSFFN